MGAWRLGPRDFDEAAVPIITGTSGSPAKKWNHEQSCVIYSPEDKQLVVIHIYSKFYPPFLDKLVHLFETVRVAEWEVVSLLRH